MLLSGAWETILVSGEVGSDEGDMGYLAREMGTEPVIVPELGRELSFWDDWKAFWKIYGIICREKPDIVHTHTAKAGALGRGAGILYRCRVSLDCARDRQGEGCKLVHTFHGHVFSGYFGWVKSWVFLWVERILALFTDRIVTVSEALKKELVEKYKIAPEGKVKVVELGFELDELLDLQAKGSGDIVNVGIVGRLVPIKNHKMLFKALNGVKGEGWRVKLIVIGDGELREDLEESARELGITDIVEFHGWVKDLREIYSGLDIVALTSLNEGTPVSIIEAMAAGRPVVATDVGGVKDIVEDGKSGYLVASEDEEKFSERLVDLIKDPERRKRFGQCGREAVRNRFSKDRLIKDIKELYKGMLKI